MANGVKKRMLLAREAIKAKEYDKARKLLEGLEHPTAIAWLAKLDKIESRKAKPKLGLVQYVIFCVIFVCALLTLWIFLASPTPGITYSELTATSVMLTNDRIQTQIVQTSEARSATNTTRNTNSNSTGNGSTTRRPANCTEAKAMGLTARQAAQWSHLDRDNDGVACYGD